jgi:hypothetical protein
MRAGLRFLGRGPSDPAGFLRRGIVSAGLVSVLLISAGCTSAPGPVSASKIEPGANGQRLIWSRVTLPQYVEPLTLTAAGTQLLVGGRAANGSVKPRLLRIASNGSMGEVRLIPHSPYAFEARWRSIASDGNRIIAVGGAPGGAHSNTRWTTWVGTSAGVAEVPQPFDTFGGWGAGDVIGPVLTRSGPAIAGSWAGAKSGLDAAVWLPVGDRWVRRPSAGSALESTPQLLVGPRSATSAGAGVLLPGSAVHLSGGTVRQSAAVWRSERVNGGWARVDLPDSGTTSEAVSARCTEQDCVVAGYVDDVLALWRVSPSAVTRIPDLPKVASSPRSPIPAPLAAGRRLIEVVSAGPNVVVLDGGDRHWTLSRGPVGSATSSAFVEGWVYVIAKPAAGPAVLWRFPSAR